MNNKIIFVYDDRSDVSSQINSFTGVNYFSNISQRKNKISEYFFNEKVISNFNLVFHIKSNEDLKSLESFASEQHYYHYLVIPSYMAPKNIDKLELLIEKCKLSLGSVKFLNTDDKIIALLFDQEKLINNYLTLPNKTFFASESIPHFDNIVRDLNNTFHDLSNWSAFIDFLWISSESRSFNSIELLPDSIKKTSKDKIKIFNEYNFYHLLSSRMKQFIVPTFNFKNNKKDGTSSYEMERIFVPDVSIQYINQSSTKDSFSNLTSLFFTYIHSREKKDISKKDSSSFFKKTIINKTNLRIDEFLSTSIGVELNKHFLSISSIDIKSLCNRSVKLLIDYNKKYPVTYLAQSHGDPCFSNILYDDNLSIFRLIDPKGASKEDELYMHPLYDLAKFSHSVLGSYDVLNHELFEFNFDTQLNITLCKNKIKFENEFKTIFQNYCKQNKINLQFVRVIELSLFISMISLHTENPKKILAFLLNAINLLTELEND